MSTSDQIAESPPASTSASRPYGYYAALIGLYQALYGIFLLFYRRKDHTLEELTALDLTMLGLATLRVAKTISEDEISIVLRQPLVHDVNGEKHPRGHGLRWALGKLVLCPTCTGTWVAALLGYALHLFPRQTRPLLAIMSASGVEQFSDALLSLVYTDRDRLRQKE
jgi:hypothetical protein